MEVEILTLLGPADKVLEKIYADRVVGAEVELAVHCAEPVHLVLGVEAGRKALGVHLHRLWAELGRLRFHLTIHFRKL